MHAHEGMVAQGFGHFRLSETGVRSVVVNDEATLIQTEGFVPPAVGAVVKKLRGHIGIPIGPKVVPFWDYPIEFQI